MKCQLYCRCDELTPYWVKWRELGDLWTKNDFHPLDVSSLKIAYHKLWFKDAEEGRPRFQVGELGFDPRFGYVSFLNGRHRTILLASLLEIVPIAVDSTILENELFDRFLLRPIEKDELIELPDLEIMTANQLRSGKHE